MTLYELTGQWQELLADYYAAEADERNAVLARMEDIDGAIDDKAEAYAKIMRNAEADIVGLKAEIKRLDDMKKSREQLIDRLKIGMLNAMEVTERKEIRTGIGKWSTQKNPFSCRVTDREKVPERFRIYPDPDDWKIDGKAAIAEHKATGEDFDGVVIEQALGIRFR